MRVAAIILAAGSSGRFGRPKQLLAFRGESLVRRTVRIASEAGCDEVIVVAQPGALRELHATIVENAGFAEGMASSIRAGVEAAGNARVLLMLCDQPLITPEHLRALLAIDAPVVATGYSGIRGVPAAFAPELRDELLALRGDRGARAIIERHDARAIVFEDAAVDIDTVADLENT
jgi:CTP:molybdopterin cytidylyltransferase MocA